MVNQELMEKQIDHLHPLMKQRNNLKKQKNKRKKKLKQATWRAYYKAGAAALVFVIIAALGLGVFRLSTTTETRSKRITGCCDGEIGKTAE